MMDLGLMMRHREVILGSIDGTVTRRNAESTGMRLVPVAPYASGFVPSAREKDGITM